MFKKCPEKEKKTDMSQNKLRKEKKLILPWIKWI